MKILFDGGSWIRGVQKGKKVIQEDESFPYQMCQMLNCDYDNHATPGGSNQKIVRHILTKYDISNYDLAIFQFTCRSRFEWVKDGEWIRVAASRRHIFWDYFYKHIYNDQYGKTMEKVHYETVRNACKLHNVPCLITTTDPKQDHIQYDFYLKNGNVKMYGGHPSAAGYKRIATDLVALLHQKNML